MTGTNAMVGAGRVGGGEASRSMCVGGQHRPGPLTVGLSIPGREFFEPASIRLCYCVFEDWQDGQKG